MKKLCLKTVKLSSKPFAIFHDMHTKLLSTDPESLIDGTVPTALDLIAVFTYWSMEMRNKKTKMLDEVTPDAHVSLLIRDPLALAMCQTVFLDQTWDYVAEYCGEMQGVAEDKDDDEAVELWETRGSILSTHEGSLDDLSGAAFDENEGEFLEALSDFTEELDCL